MVLSTTSTTAKMKMKAASVSVAAAVAITLIMCLVFAVTITTTNAMVVIPKARMTTTNNKGATSASATLASTTSSSSASSSSSSSSSDDLLRKLINQQIGSSSLSSSKQSPSPSSYTFDPTTTISSSSNSNNDDDNKHHHNTPTATATHDAAAVAVNGVKTFPTTTPSNNVLQPIQIQQQQIQSSPLLDEYREYEILRESNLENEILEKFFFQSGYQRKLIIVNRFIQLFTTLNTARKEWTNSQFVEYEEVRLEANSKVDDPAAVRLCESIASLGPLAVKLGQTLSQRPDIVGKPACDALKRLQTQNSPFANDIAYACIRESLNYWNHPLAANDNTIIKENNDDKNDNDDGTTAADLNSKTTNSNMNNSNNNKPLFQYLSKDPIASASLGQVYKATTFDGNDIAVKVQRPEALSIIAIDTQCFRIVFDLRSKYIDITEKINQLFSTFSTTTKSSDSSSNHTPETGMTEDEVRALGDEGTVSDVINRVAADIKRELDYNIEASNSYKFRDSLQFLGFVDTPDVVLATNKILMTSFVDGHHLSNLNNTKSQIALTRMAVEACTASMVLTGFVHADPHEGNLMLRTRDQKIVFLDFGLMSDVSQTIMEAFARGIQALLSEDFDVLTEAFIDTNFITSPIMYRAKTTELWKTLPPAGVKSSQEQLAIELEIAMKTTDGGLSRFGSLATVLNKKISPNWLVFTPPYVLLLVRTFLTLEGIAAQVDPEFNIYEMSLPWVVRRSLSPSTDKGIDVLRNTILKSNNKIQWERLLDLINSTTNNSQEKEEDDDDTTSAVAVTETVESSVSLPTQSSASSSTVVTASTNETPTTATATTSVSPIASSLSPLEDHENEKELNEQKQKEYDDSRNAAMKDAVGTLLGSTEGKALRGVLKDLDTPDLIWKLGSIEGRPILKMATTKVVNSFSLFTSTRGSSSSIINEKVAVLVEDIRPISEECKELRERQIQRTKLVTRLLVKKQLKSCLFSFKGIIGTSRLLLGMIQITTSILMQKMIRKLLLLTTTREKPKTKSPLF